MSLPSSKFSVKCYNFFHRKVGMGPSLKFQVQPSGCI